MLGGSKHESAPPPCVMAVLMFLGSFKFSKSPSIQMSLLLSALRSQVPRSPEMQSIDPISSRRSQGAFICSRNRQRIKKEKAQRGHTASDSDSGPLHLPIKQ